MKATDLSMTDVGIMVRCDFVTKGDANHPQRTLVPSFVPDAHHLTLAKRGLVERDSTSPIGWRLSFLGVTLLEELFRGCEPDPPPGPYRSFEECHGTPLPVVQSVTPSPKIPPVYTYNPEPL